MKETMSGPVQKALDHIDYLNMIVVSAAAAPARLPVVVANPDIDAALLQQQLGSLVCLMQAHFADLSAALRDGNQDAVRFAGFDALAQDTITRIQRDENAMQSIHRHIRNIFAFEGSIHSDQSGEHGVYLRHEQADYALGVVWLLDVLTGVESGRALDAILGDAQNTDVCTRLCFGDAVKMLEAWRRDAQMIMPASATRM